MNPHPALLNQLDVVETLAISWYDSTAYNPYGETQGFCKACRRKVVAYDTFSARVYPETHRSYVSQRLTEHIKSSPQCVVFRLARGEPE